MSAEPDRSHQKPPFLKRVRIRNYKSIKFCDVELEPLTVLVGRNGSGKSNFVDALGFLRDVETRGLQQAVEAHGGTDAILFRGSPGRKIEIAITYSVSEVAGLTEFDYSNIFSVDVLGRWQYYRESLVVRNSAGDVVDGFKARVDGVNIHLEWTVTRDDRSQMVSMAGGGRMVLPSLVLHPKYGLCLFSLAGILNYNFVPSSMRVLAPTQSGGQLLSDGSNLASVIKGIQASDVNALNRIRQYLAAITGNVQYTDILSAGGYDIVGFRVLAKGEELDFPAASMSDGTLRAFAALVAVFQQTSQGPPSLVAIEEPETSLHPAASAALVDAFDEATGRTQILITTHSTELLDNPTIQPKNVRVVEMIDGETVITGVNAASVKNVVEGLNTLGGLERENRLKVNVVDLKALREAEARVPQ